MSQAGFWDKPAEAQATVLKLKTLKKLIEPWQKVSREAKELQELLDLVGEDEKSLSELEANFKKISHDVEKYERKYEDKVIGRCHFGVSCLRLPIMGRMGRLFYIRLPGMGVLW